MESAAETTVLCVEDEDLQLSSRQQLFESAGFRVLAARTGSEALQLFRSNEVNLVVLDYWMAGMNGLAVATELKRIRPRTPIIVLSGLASLPGETIGLVDAWFQKAKVQPEELLDEAGRLVRQGRQAT